MASDMCLKLGQIKIGEAGNEAFLIMEIEMKKLITLTTGLSLLLASPALAKNPNSVANVDVEFTSCTEIQITSSKDISNIVYEIDGVHVKIEDIDTETFTLPNAGDVTTVWVKSGNNKSGDGPGYGERFEVSPEQLETLSLDVTADNIQESWINGVAQLSNFPDNFQRSDLFEVEINRCEDNVIAIEATNFGGPVGLIATVDIDGSPYSVTGDGQWLMSPVDETDWTTVGFDDSAWDPAVQCASSVYPGAWTFWFRFLLADGARVIWQNSGCGDRNTATYFRLNIPAL